MDESLSQEQTALDDATASESTYSATFVFEPGLALARLRAWAVARRAGLFCVLLLALASAQMLAVVSRKSITIDEIVMIPSSYYHLAAANFQLVNEHPPLSKMLAAVPLLFIQPEEILPARIGAPPYSPNARWAYQESFWEGNPTLYDSISFWARVPMIALTIALGALVFIFARELFGARAAVLAVALFALEPTVLAHGRVVQTDIPAAFGYLLLFFTLRRYARAPTSRLAAFVGVAAGVALIAKYSMLLAGPVLAVFFLFQLWRAPRSEQGRSIVIAHASIVFVSILLVINASYFFQHRALLPPDLEWIQKSFPSSASAVTGAVRALSYLLPTDFVLGIFFQVWHNGEGHAAGLLGMYSNTGWWYYFPVAFALKTTLPFLFLSLASLAWGVREWLKRREQRLLWMLVPFAAYAAFVLMSRIDIGVRYCLPAYTFLFILGGALLDRLLKSRRAGRAGVITAVAMLCWIGVEAVRAHPDQMTYMNQFASRAPHWWYLSDSNVEWGDDTRDLAEYLRAQGETHVRGAFLGGFLLLHHYGVAYDNVLAPETANAPPTRYTAIGASYLNGSTVPSWQKADGRTVTEDERVSTFDAYRNRTPEKIFGGSIYLYREDAR